MKNTCGLSFPSLAAALGLLLGAHLPARGQLPAPSPVPASPPAAAPTAPASPATGSSRLRDYEITYQDGLRRIHLPLLTTYLTRLTQLASTTGSTDPALNQEITRVQKLIADGGIIDLRTLLPTQEDAPPPPMPMPPPSAPPGAVLVLKPEEATGARFTSTPPTALIMGEATWDIPRLDEGNYEILVLYSMPTLSEAGTLTVTFAGEEITHAITPDRTTKDDQPRILRLGRIKLNRDAISKSLHIEMTPTTATGLQIRQVVIARPRLSKP